MKKFHEKHKDLLTAEGFIMISQSENNTNYKRDDDMFINIKKRMIIMSLSNQFYQTMMLNIQQQSASMTLQTSLNV